MKWVHLNTVFVQYKRIMVNLWDGSHPISSVLLDRNNRPMECDICAGSKVKSSSLKSNFDLLTLSLYRSRLFFFLLFHFLYRLSSRFNIDKTFD